MADATSANNPSRSWRRWVALVGFGAFFAVLLWTVVNPYRGQDYEEVPHGDHSHYMPKDRDPDVPVSRFPTRPPEKGERITPDGRIVSESGDQDDR